MRLFRAASFVFVVFLLFSLLGVVSAKMVNVYVTDESTGDGIGGAQVIATIQGQGGNPVNLTPTNSDGYTQEYNFPWESTFSVEVSAEGYETKTTDGIYVFVISTVPVELVATGPVSECPNDICEAGENEFSCPEDCPFVEGTSFVLNVGLENAECSGDYVERGSFFDHLSTERHLCVERISTFDESKLYVNGSYFEFDTSVPEEECSKGGLKDVSFSIGTALVNHCVSKDAILQEQFDDYEKQIVLDAAVVNTSSCPSGYSPSGPFSISTGETILYCVRYLFEPSAGQGGDCEISNPKWVDPDNIPFGVVTGESGAVGPINGTYEGIEGNGAFLVVDTTVGCVSDTIIFEVKKGLDEDFWSTYTTFTVSGLDENRAYVQWSPVWFENPAPGAEDEPVYYSFISKIQGTSVELPRSEFLKVEKPAEGFSGDCVLSGATWKLGSTDVTNEDTVFGWAPDDEHHDGDIVNLHVSGNSREACEGKTVMFEIYELDAWFDPDDPIVQYEGTYGTTPINFYRMGWQPPWVPDFIEDLLGLELKYKFKAYIEGEEGNKVETDIALRVVEPRERECDPGECPRGRTCVGGLCFAECDGNADCVSPERICNTETGMCVECLTENHCTNPEKGLCNENSTCVGCITDDDCSEEGLLACEGNDWVCVECTLDAHCNEEGLPVCDTGPNTCAEDRCEIESADWTSYEVVGYADGFADSVSVAAHMSVSISNLEGDPNLNCRNTPIMFTLYESDFSRTGLDPVWSSDLPLAADTEGNALLSRSLRWFEEDAGHSDSDPEYVFKAWVDGSDRDTDSMMSEEVSVTRPECSSISDCREGYDCVDSDCVLIVEEEEEEEPEEDSWTDFIKDIIPKVIDGIIGGAVGWFTGGLGGAALGFISGFMGGGGGLGDILGGFFSYLGVIF
ncbi:MAG: hypothetical protein KJ718_03075 [Nanoarchaeota archaeon]|nr:hypothetical protein [Nanoarchaeota archaeon]MBU1051512.1 hypothetical protein [Nanoarchaeota archaeon]MBU1988960.1 hypothetical protein [Nanoarchaeota archaeon]